MDIVKLNTLVDNIRTVYSHLTFGTREYFVENMLKYKIEDIKKDFGKYLETRLSATYKNYFPFNEPTAVEDYLTPDGVPVEKDDSGDPLFYVSIQSYPLRIVLSSPALDYEKTAWVLNGRNN